MTEPPKTSNGAIRDNAGYLNDLGRDLGESRFQAFIQGHSAVQAQAMFLTMAVVTAPHHGYSDEILAILLNDAEDLRAAADQWADSCRDLAQAWRRQRDADQEVRQR